MGGAGTVLGGARAKPGAQQAAAVMQRDMLKAARKGGAAKGKGASNQDMQHAPAPPAPPVNIDAACARCGAAAPAAQCARCKVIKYCGAECQRAHWPEHKGDCATGLPSTTA
jgi:hypothetical protein